MRKFTLSILYFLLINLIIFTSFAETTASNVSEMSVEELLALRDQIDFLLKEKGYSIYFDIERGSKGEEVSAIQQRLFELGFYSGKITGKFESETQKAFKLFEKTNGLKNDGLASKEDQLILFGNEVIPKETSTPNASPSAVLQKNNEHKVEHDLSFDYTDCLRYPDKHVGENYTLKGKVEQTLGNRNDGFQIRFSVLGNSEEIIYIYITKDPGFNILEKDMLIVNLTMSGTITYESIWKQEITIPAALASDVVLR